MKRAPLFVFLPVLLMLGGCCTDQSSPGTGHGLAYNNWFSAQVVNPGAPNDPSPAATLPGKVAMDIHDKRYMADMTEKEKHNEGKVRSQFGDSGRQSN